MGFLMFFLSKPAPFFLEETESKIKIRKRTLNFTKNQTSKSQAHKKLWLGIKIMNIHATALSEKGRIFSIIGDFVLDD